MGRGFGKAAGSKSDSRALTPVIGLVLLLGIVALASLGILLAAGDHSEEVQQRAEAERVESAFLELRHELRTTAASQDVARSVNLDVAGMGGRVDRVDGGTVRIDVEGEPPVERSLGSLEYTASDGSRVVYQAGGVWRIADGGVRAVSEPAIHFSDGTLTFPVAVLAFDGDGDRVGTDALELRTEQIDPLYSDLNRENVTITIESEFYEWWGEYFASIERAASDVTVHTDPGAKTANVTFEASDPGLQFGDELDGSSAVETEGALETAEEVTDSIVGDVASKDDVSVRMKVDGNVVSRGDVHFSREGEATGLVVADGSVTGRHYGVGAVIAGGNSIVLGQVDRDVHVDGDVEIQSAVGGDVYATGDVEIRGDIDGNVSAGGTIDFYYGTVSGTLTGDRINNVYNSGVCGGVTCREETADLSAMRDPSAFTDDLPTRASIDDFYERGVGTSDADHVGTLTPDDGPLTAGTYVVDEIDVSGDPLVFDVGAGDVNVFVRGPIEMGPDGDIRVLNSGSGNAARVFADDEVRFHGSGGACSAPNPLMDCEAVPDVQRDANGFQLYGTSDSSFDFGGGLDYHGVIYAPQWEVEVSASGSIDTYGPVIVGTIDAGGEVSFEHAPHTSFVTPVVDGGSTARSERPTYLHVTAHEVVVAGE